MDLARRSCQRGVRLKTQHASFFTFNLSLKHSVHGCGVGIWSAPGRHGGRPLQASTNACVGRRMLSLVSRLLIGLLAAASPVRAACPDLARACWAGVDDAIQHAIDSKSIPGAVMLVGQDDHVIVCKAYGSRSLKPEQTPMDVGTVFDLASLSKVVGCATSVMVLADRGKLQLTDKVSRYLPDFAANGKGDITIEQLLLHRGGLIPDNPLKDYESGPAAALANVFALKTSYEPGTKFDYSDVGYIVLGEIVRVVSGKPLDEFAHEAIFEPLSMNATVYKPKDPLRKRCAPTEEREGRWMVGEVHDPRAYLLGGVAGHAGLFSTADDLARFCRMIVNRGELAGTRILSPAAVDDMVKPRCLPDGGGCRGYGWDIGTDYSSPRGRLFAKGTSIGHTGYTGTSFWLDLPSKVYVILLTNYVHPKDAHRPITALRREVGTLVAAALMAEGKVPVPPASAPAGDQKAAYSGPGRVAYPSEKAADASERVAHPSRSDGWVDDDEKTGSAAMAEGPAREAASAVRELNACGDASAVAIIGTPSFASQRMDHPGILGGPQGPGSGLRNAAGPPADVLCGLDVLERDGFKLLQGRKIALITNHSGRDRQGRRTVDLLAKAPGVQLVKLFSPEHGLYGTLDEHVGNTVDKATGLPVLSLYGKTRRPSAEMLEGVDTLVYDIQDIGARFYTYPATLGNCMEEAAKHKLKVVVLDRPNPITGLIVDGPLADPDRLGFTAYMPMPVSHGMTIGELAKMFNVERKIQCDLTVVPVEGWKRDMWWDETGLMWVNPSPNIRDLTQATLYPGVCLLEATNVSVGRGTDQPFELIGAPWIDGRELAAALNGARLPGLRFYPIEFTPTSSKFKNERCQGVFIVVTDRTALQLVRSGLTMAWTLKSLFGAQFQIDKVNNLLVNAETLAALKAIDDPAKLPAGWKDDVQKFVQIRQTHLIYH